MFDLIDENAIDNFRTVREEEIERFDPVAAAKTLKPIVQRRSRDTLFIARVMFIAHQYYTELGKEKRTLNLKQITVLDLPEGCQSFLEFCVAADIPQRSAYNYINKFVPGSSPEEDRLLTHEEIKAIRAERNRLEFIRVGKLVSQYQMTGKKGDGWDNKCDRELTSRIIQDRMSKETDAWLAAGGKVEPKQLEFDFDGYVEHVLDGVTDLAIKFEIAEDMIRRIRRIVSKYV